MNQFDARHYPVQTGDGGDGKQATRELFNNSIGQVDIAEVIQDTPELITPLFTFGTPRVVETDKRHKSAFRQ